MKIFKIVTIISVLALLSCSDDDIADQTQGDLKLLFDNQVGDQELILNNENYEKNGDEMIQIDELKYVISNIQLEKENGEIFTYPVEDSYFVINEEDEQSLNLNLGDIPVGDYTGIRFGFGIDQSEYPLNGVDNFIPTAEENGMLWAWAAGYKFLKFEGSYSTGISSGFQPFIYHVGSHGENLDNYKEIELDFGQSLSIDQYEQRVDIKMDVLKIFDATYQLNLADKDDIQVDPVNAPKVSENMKRSFEIKDIITDTLFSNQ